jgi:hypothetical protein
VDPIPITSAAESARNLACPLCDGIDVLPVLSWPAVPSRQNAPVADQADALACPRGDIRLVHCLGCELVFNAAFDPGLTAYSVGYEPSQASSPTFVRYLDELARELVARHALRGKTIVEIGCGNGDFLVRLCREGANRGIGFDPSYDGEGDPLPPNVTIRSERYSSGGIGPADLVCARHVIEHIARPVAFLADVSRAAEGRDGSVVFIETPRLEWILDQSAFWDIFYEHCSYFTAPALARLVARAGLAVSQAGASFEGQYQWVEGRSGSRPGLVAGVGREASARLPLRLDAFARNAEACRTEWRERIAERALRGTCLVWGAGAKGVTFLNALALGLDMVPAVIDMNPRKQGRHVPGTGQPIVSPHALSRYRVSTILVMNPNYLDEIRTMARTVAPSADVLAI